MTTHYTASDGKLHAIADIQFPHLKAATEKLQGKITDNTHRLNELAAMKQELSRREAKFAADVASLKARGFICCGPTDLVQGGGYFIEAPGRAAVATGKTADAAWFKAIAIIAKELGQ